MQQFVNILIACLFLLVGCSRQKQKDKVDIGKPYAETTDYAGGYSISTNSWGFYIDVNNPWQGAKDVTYRYAFINEKSGFIPSDANEIVHLPVSRVVCLSTTHIAFIDLLSETSKIVGVSGVQYISNEHIDKRVNDGLIKDVGYEQAINIELIMSIKPDIVFSYGVGAEAAGYLHKLKELKIPVVFIGDYLEDSPLGKAEWIKAFGMIFGKAELADSLFYQMADEYCRTAKLVKEVQTKPKVFINLPWNEVWYFPGSQGYMARLIGDAGGDYLMNDLPGNRSHPYSIESALVRAMDADIWINTGSYVSLQQIGDAFPRLKSIPAYQNGMVFNNNLRSLPSGGNDFWESGAVSPHLVLKDLVSIFHPGIISHQMVYYKQLN